MADFVGTLDKADNHGIQFRFKDKGDGTHALVIESSVGDVTVDNSGVEALLEAIRVELVNGTLTVDTQLLQALTDAQLRAAPVEVDDGHPDPQTDALTNAQLRASAVPVSGPLTDAQLRAAAVDVDTGLAPLTDAQLRATAVPVSGPLTDAQLRATAVPVSGPLTDAQLRASAVPVSGTVGVSNMIPAVETGLSKDATLVSVRDDVARKWDPVTPTPALVNTSGDNVVVSPSPGNALELVWIYCQGDPAMTDSVVVTVKFGTTELYKFTLEASQPFARSPVVNGGVDEDLIVHLSASKAVYVNTETREV